jgi:hypothetical protein
MDMSKWAQDESGQWFRVTYRNGEDVLYDRSKPYEERVVGWVKTKRYVKKWGWIGFLSAICFIISYFLMDDGRTLHNYVDLAARGVFCFAGASTFISFLNWSVAGSYLAEGEANFVGPAPIAPPTLDESLSHNTRNDARQPDIDDIERALRAREGRGGDGEPQYKFKA